MTRASNSAANLPRGVCSGARASLHHSCIFAVICGVLLRSLCCSLHARPPFLSPPSASSPFILLPLRWTTVYLLRRRQLTDGVLSPKNSRYGQVERSSQAICLVFSPLSSLPPRRHEPLPTRHTVIITALSSADRHGDCYANIHSASARLGLVSAFPLRALSDQPPPS
jgi:hypothetical protein